MTDQPDRFHLANYKCQVSSLKSQNMSSLEMLVSLLISITQKEYFKKVNVIVIEVCI